MRKFCKSVDLEVQQVAFFYCENWSRKTDLLQRAKGTQTSEDVSSFSSMR